MPQNESTTEEVNTQDIEVAETEDSGSDTAADTTVSDSGSDRTETSNDSDLDDNPFEEASEKVEEKSDETAAKTDEFDSDLDEWAEKAGREKPESDRDRKFLQEIRNNQRDFHASRQAKKAADKMESTTKEIEKEVKSDSSESPDKISQLETQVVAERTLRLQSEYYQSNNISEETGNLMAEILKEKVTSAPESERQAELKYWSDPRRLQDLHELATAREINSSGKVIADEAAQKERDRIAKESQGAGPNRNAKAQKPADKKDPVDELWEKW